MFFSRRTLARTASALFALIIAAVLLPVALATPASAAPADTIHGLVNQARWDNVQHGLVNQARWDNVQHGLIRNSAMDKVALDWAKNMAANNTMAHNPNYSSQIPAGWNVAGENVAQGHRTAQAMHDGWMSSSGHRANILGGFTDVGIAFYESGGTTWGVQVFAAYPGHTGPAAPAAPAPAPALVPESEPSQAGSPSAKAEPTPIASPDAANGASRTPSASAGSTNSATPPSLSRSELQANVYSERVDLRWIAWVIFAGFALFGGAGWFVFLRNGARS